MMKYKIGRYVYEEVQMDEFGQPKIIADELESENIFSLVDFDGEVVKFFKRIK